MARYERSNYQDGFTLIELSIVLVIIGLIVGGVLTGRDLIKAAEVRATITQIEKYNTAANTFYGKYGALPGDLNQQVAAQFGFATRGNTAGEGDGNGIIQGNCLYDISACMITGEAGAFWVDLSTARLIDGGFTTALPANPATSLPEITGSQIANYLPQAKLGQGNYFYVYSGATYFTLAPGYTTTPYTPTGQNYFAITAISSLLANNGYPDVAGPGLTVAQAYSIDKKVDDGLPLAGNVTAVDVEGPNVVWPGTGGDGPMYGSPPIQTPSSSTACFDNGNVANTTQQYSVEISNGANVNCALSFKMQAGD